MTDGDIDFSAPRTLARSSPHEAVWPRGMMLLVSFLVLAFIFAFRLTVVVDGGIIDPDYYWHLKTGEWIVHHGELPKGDIFSYSVEGKAWILHEWLFQVLLYAAFQIGGERLVLFLTALLAAGALTVCLKMAAERLGNPLIALLLTLSLLSAYIGFVVPRPHVFSYLFFALLLHALWRARYDGRYWSLFLIPLIMPLWVNLHGGYFIALAFFFCFAGLETFRLMLMSGVVRSRYAYLKTLWASACLSLIGSFVNPEGPAHLLYPLYVMGQSASQSFIAEWASFDFHEPLARWYLIAVLAFLALVIYRERRPDLTETAIPLLTLLAGFTSMRHAPFAVMVMIVYASEAISAGALNPIKAAASNLTPSSLLWKRLRHGERQKRTLSVRAETTLLSGISVLLLALVVTTAVVPSYLQSREPVWSNLISFIEENNLQGHMLNQYGLGGFLIYELSPERSVFIDGRADLYGDDFIDRYHEMVSGSPSWRELFESEGFSYVILNKKIPLAALLDLHPQYGKAFENEDGITVYLRRGEQHDALIEAFLHHPVE